MNDLPTTQPARPSFYSVCLMYNFDGYGLQLLSTLANVADSVVEAMFVNEAIRRKDADKVLAALSTFTGDTWNLNNIQVVLQPTFQDLHTIHNFNLDMISKSSGVPYAVLDMMLVGDPVSAQDARLVLQIASRLASKYYTLESVDIPLETGD